MREKKRVVILPFDGILDLNSLKKKVKEALDNEPLCSILSHIKINDVAHLEDCPGPQVVREIKKMIDEFGLSEEVGVMLDLKLGDTSGTLSNYGKHYNLSELDILTVSAICSVRGFFSIRQSFPKNKVALVSALTDMNQSECLIRFGSPPKSKIFRDVSTIEEYSSSNSRSLFDLIVCSPLELSFLRRNLENGLGFITPGIRDEWMVAGQQNRFTGVRAALESGATFVVMGSQLTKGNPETGISAEESIRRTIEEIEKADF